MTPDDPAFRRMYPFASRYHDVDAARMHYVDEGEGPPVVMVHGNPTWSFYFRELIKALRPTHRCIALDHIGCGLSDKPRDATAERVGEPAIAQHAAAGGPFSSVRDPRSADHSAGYSYTLQRRVDDLESLLDGIGLTEPATFVLHDWGGMIGMAAALRRPKRVGAFVILNTAAFLMPQRKYLPLRLRILRDGGPLAELIVRGLNGFARGAASMAVCRPLPRDVRDAYLMPYDTWAHRVAVLRFVQDIPLASGDPSYELARWVDERMTTLADRPALICWGLRDFVFDADYLAEWRRRWPHAAVEAFPDAGHYVLEDQRDAILARVRAFLSELPSH